MSTFAFGIKSVSPGDDAAPSIVSYSTARSASTDRLLVVRDGPDESDTVFQVRKNGGVVSEGALIQPFQTFTAGDATPSIEGAVNFKTDNSSATTITDLDDGVDGQLVRVVIDDANTTIDFTGTNLNGNGGADWTPAQGDHMTCVFDGTSWFCDISDNTA